MLQALPELLLLRRRQPPELGIVLQHTFLFVGRQILVTTQPVARVTLLLPRTWRLSWRLLLGVWLALQGLVSLSRRLVSILLRRAGRGKVKHGGYTCHCQPSRHMFRAFQLSRLLSRVCRFFYSCFGQLLPT